MILTLLSKERIFKEQLTGTYRRSIIDKLRLTIPKAYIQIINKKDKSGVFYIIEDSKNNNSCLVVPKIVLDDLIPISHLPAFNRDKLDEQNRIVLPETYKKTHDVYVHGFGNFMLIHPNKYTDISKLVTIEYLN